MLIEDSVLETSASLGLKNSQCLTSPLSSSHDRFSQSGHFHVFLGINCFLLVIIFFHNNRKTITEEKCLMWACWVKAVLKAFAFVLWSKGKIIFRHNGLSLLLRVYEDLVLFLCSVNCWGIPGNVHSTEALLPKNLARISSLVYESVAKEDSCPIATTLNRPPRNWNEGDFVGWGSLEGGSDGYDGRIAPCEPSKCPSVQLFQVRIKKDHLQ